MFWLKKAISFCLMPFPASLGLMVGGLLLSRRKGCGGLGKGIVLCGLLLLLVLGNREVGRRLLAPLEQQYPALPEFAAGYTLPPELERCRYIVVLGGGHTDTGLLPATSQLSSYALGRLIEAVRISRLLPEAQIITSGPGAKDRPSHAEILARAAQSLGVAQHRFILIDKGRDTEGEAETVRGVVGNAPFALVTSAWHMPRAMALMRAAGLDPYPCPADFHAVAPDEFALSDWLWGIDGLEKSTWAVYERLGYTWARWRGKVN